ncbi:MAG: T9SS type B sorting domain-containing protein, partial [Prevotellaceae bacterium]|nr:T9SS type B sorting domain-containing protein [Prevotellaceae bacterium]
LTCATPIISVTASGGTIYSWTGGSSTNTAENTFDTEGEYTVTVTDANACTNTESITINEDKTPPTAEITPSATELTCDVTSITLIPGGGGTYRWLNGGETVTEPDTYRLEVTAANGCKDTAEVVITQNAFSTGLIEEIFICANEFYLWRGNNYNIQGIYRDSLKIESNGCYDYFVLDLSVMPLPTKTITASICSTETYDFYGKMLNESGTYIDTIAAVGDCDTIVVLDLTVNDLIQKQIDASICVPDTYNFHGTFLNVTGIYIDTIQGALCDTIITLKLTVNPKYEFAPESHSICDGENYSWHGKNYNATGTYYDSLKTVLGACDSVYVLKLTVNPKYEFAENQTICAGESYVWHGQILSVANTYYDSLQTVVGSCDSVYVLYLTVIPKYEFIENYTICADGNYTWHSKNLVAAGTYYDSLQTVVGSCDSVYVLTLTVNQPSDTTKFVAAICQGETYALHGFSQSTTGIFYQNFKNVLGCDSIVMLSLTVKNKTYDTDMQTACETFTWIDGNTYTASNNSATYTLTNAAGCDSIVTLNLTINKNITTPVSAQICAGESYNFSGNVLTTAGNYEKKLLSTAGCDSTVLLTLTVGTPKYNEIFESTCKNEPYDFFGENKNTTGRYEKTVTLAGGCDSTVVLHLTVLPVYQEITHEEIFEGEKYPFYGENLQSEGIYSQTLHSAQGCDSVIVLYLSVKPVPQCPEIEIPMFFTPNADGWNDNWEIKNLDCYDYRINLYDRFGKELFVWENNFTGWDGMYLGKPMPSTDYWYLIVIDGAKRFIGHFTLLR